MSDPLQPSTLAAPGSEQRWHQLQRIRRGAGPVQPWIAALADGELIAASDLLAALWGRLERSDVETLLNSPAADDPTPWLMAAQLELPQLARQTGTRDAWLEPLLVLQAEAPPVEALTWLQLLGQLQDPRVAARLRQVLAPLAAEPGMTAPDGLVPAPDCAAQLLPVAAVAAMPPCDLALPLVPLLGLQRDPADAGFLQRLALRPGPLMLRRAALEGLAVGLSCWPAEPLASCLERLADDLDPALAGAAVDLLARLPQGQRPLRRLLRRRLDPMVRARLRRRLRPTPLVLLVHGRQGGLIPPELVSLATELARRRGAPVLLQALTGLAPETDESFWAAARRAEGLSLVPLLLLPGGHVRSDLPAIASAWRTRAAAAQVPLQRLPFLGAWPTWQQTLARTLNQAAANSAALPLWLHHPLEGALSRRFLAHLSDVLQARGVAAPYTTGVAELELQTREPVLLLPLTLAANRLSDTLAGGASAAIRVLPPLLQSPALREDLIASLETLP